METHQRPWRCRGSSAVPPQTEREIEAIETLDQWSGRNDRYFESREAAAGASTSCAWMSCGRKWELVIVAEEP